VLIKEAVEFYRSHQPDEGERHDEPEDMDVDDDAGPQAAIAVGTKRSVASEKEKAHAYALKMG